MDAAVPAPWQGVEAWHNALSAVVEAVMSLRELGTAAARNAPPRAATVPMPLRHTYRPKPAPPWVDFAAQCAVRHDARLAAEVVGCATEECNGLCAPEYTEATGAGVLAVPRCT